MQFAYEGFTQNANERRYAFHGMKRVNRVMLMSSA